CLVAGPPRVEGQVRDGDVVDVVAAHRVGAGDAVHDVGAAGTTEVERHDHVGVVVGVVLVGRRLAGLTGQGTVELALPGAGQVAGLVVGGDDEQGLVPGGVLLDPGDDGLDGVVEGTDLLDVTGDVVGVSGPVDGTCLDHEVETVLVLV